MIDKTLFIINTLSLTYASYLDIKSREITDKIWLIMLILNIPYTIYCILTIKYRFLLYLYLFNSIVSIILFILCGYFGLMGGADAKALIVLQLAEFNSVFPSSLSIYINAVLISLIVIPYILYRNILYYVKNKYLFKAKIPLYKKILVLISSYKIRYIGDFGKKKYFYAILGRDNEKIRLKVVLSEEDFKVNENIRVGDEIWVSPTIPLIVFITIGYIVYKFWGNLVLKFF